MSKYQSQQMTQRGLLNIMNNNQLNVFLESDFVLFGAIALLILVLLLKGIKVAPEGRAKIVERLGRRNKTIFPGINIIIPFVDKVKIINETVTTKVRGMSVSLVDNGAMILAEQRMDPDSKLLLAKDNSQINVDPVVYFRITEPAKLVYDVQDFEESFETLIETTLRQEVGKYDGDTIITSRDTLGDALKQGLLEAARNSGIEIRRVEIEDISFDAEVTRSLSDARQEELKRRAELVAKKAEAEQLTLAAEAESKALLLKAEAEAEAVRLTAQADFDAKKIASRSHLFATVQRTRRDCTRLCSHRQIPEGKSRSHCRSGGFESAGKDRRKPWSISKCIDCPQ